MMHGTIITPHHSLKAKEKHHARHILDTVQHACPGARRAGRGDLRLMTTTP
jgi:hypothetical protein